MGHDDTESDSNGSAVRQESRSSIVIKAIPLSFADDKKTKETFWEAYGAYLEREGVDHSYSTPEPEKFERKIRDKFPKELERKFKEFLSAAYPPGTAGDEIVKKRKLALNAVKFSVGDITYGTVDILTIIDNLDKVVDAFILTAASVTAILSPYAPGALNEALGDHRPQWSIEFQDINIPSPGQPESIGRMQQIIKDRTRQLFGWKLLNALWFLPVLVTLLVLIYTWTEMYRTIWSYDEGLRNIQSDEIRRVAARSDFFDQQYALLLQRYEQTTNLLNARLDEEIKTANARSDFFDKQYVLLLQHYENLSKETTETVRTLVQNIVPPACANKEKLHQKIMEVKCHASPNLK